MDIKPLGSMPSRRPPADYFTGTVWQDPIIEAPAPARIRGAFVRFEPRARTAWHTHPLGQTLHVVSGVGRVALWGGPVREIRAGDTVWIAPGEKHWHGAAPKAAMVHIAMQEALDGSHVTWMEHVTDAQYGAAVGGVNTRVSDHTDSGEFMIAKQKKRKRVFAAAKGGISQGSKMTAKRASATRRGRKDGFAAKLLSLKGSVPDDVVL